MVNSWKNQRGLPWRLALSWRTRGLIPRNPTERSQFERNSAERRQALRLWRETGNGVKELHKLVEVQLQVNGFGLFRPLTENEKKQKAKEEARENGAEDQLPLSRGQRRRKAKYEAVHRVAERIRTSDDPEAKEKEEAAAHRDRLRKKYEERSLETTVDDEDDFKERRRSRHNDAPASSTSEGFFRPAEDIPIIQLAGEKRKREKQREEAEEERDQRKRKERIEEMEARGKKLTLIESALEREKKKTDLSKKRRKEIEEQKKELKKKKYNFEQIVLKENLKSKYLNIIHKSAQETDRMRRLNAPLSVDLSQNPTTSLLSDAERANWRDSKCPFDVDQRKPASNCVWDAEPHRHEVKVRIVSPVRYQTYEEYENQRVRRKWKTFNRLFYLFHTIAVFS